jgi:hypothetical protein
LNKFKKNFKEQIPEIKNEYVRKQLYKEALPVYGDGIEVVEQMNLLIQKAENLSLKNFNGLIVRAINKRISRDNYIFT